MNDNNIAEKIARLRKEKGLTQSQLAEMINVSNKTISRWETGEGYPEISLLMPLAKALGVTTDYLLGSAQEQAQEQPFTSAGDAQGQAQAEGAAAGQAAQTDGPRYYTGPTEAKPRKHGDRPTEKFSCRPAQMYRCYQSLTIFNKIGVWTAGLCLLVILCSSFFWARSASAALLLQLVSLLVLALPQAGLLSIAIGFVLGLADLYDRQVKSAIITAAANLIVGFLVPLIRILAVGFLVSSF